MKTMGTYNFLTGPAGAGKTEYIYETLTRRALQEPDRQFYLFVPEQNTLKAQQEIIWHSPVNGMLNLDVLSMSLLSYRVLEELDVKAPELLDEVAKTMLLRKALSEVKGQLAVYGRKVNSPGFMMQLKKLITEFGQYKVTPAALLAAAKGREGTLLGAKLQDTAKILTAFYDDLHREDGQAIPEEMPGILLKHIGASRMLNHAEIWFDSFTGFTPVQLEVLSEIVKKADHTTIAMTIPREEKTKKNGHFSDLFWFPRTGINRVIDVMSRNGLIHAEDAELDAAKAARAESEKPGMEMSHVHAPAAEKKVFYADDPTEEISFIAEDILRKTSAGSRYRDIALCVSDMNAYREIIRREFSLRNLSFFMDDPATGDTSPVTGLLRSALAMVKNGYEFEDVITYLRNPYVTKREERETLDHLENYLRETGRHGRKHYEESWQLASYIPEGYDVTALEAFRDEKLSPVFFLHDGLKAEKTAGGKAAAAERFLRELFGITAEEGSEETEIDIRENECETEEEQTDLRFLKMLFSMTDRIESLLSEEPMSMQSFAEMIQAGLSEMNAGRIPTTLDCVTVGDLKRSRLDGIRWLYLVGANEGKIPSAVTGGGIFTDTERRELMSSDLEMAPDDRRDASVQEYYLYLTENKPKNGLIITYPFADRDGKGLRRSSHVKEKGERIPYGEKKFRERKQSKVSGITETISKETACFVYDNTLHGSVTSAETYRKCPFAYFANYGLHLMERKNRDIEAVDMGKVYHAALDSAVRRLQEEKKELARVSDTELDILADSVVGRAVSDYSGSLFLSDARSRYLSGEILKTVKRTLKNLAAQQRAGNFAVCATEKKFAVKEPGLELTGIIDRIDTAQSADGVRTFVNVIDYKSGSREADLTRMMDGLDMQLATYLTEAVRLVEESGKLPGTVQPAGMYYYHISDPIVKEGEDAALKMAMNGVTAQEEEVLAATDRELLSSGEKSPVNGLKYDGKKGKITGGTVLAPELLEGLLSHTRQVMKEDAGKILDGDIRVYPYRYGESTGCDYCRFAAVCGMDRRAGKKMRRVEKADLSKIGENID